MAGGRDEGDNPHPVVTNRMKGVNIVGTSPEKSKSMPPLLDEPAADTLLVVRSTSARSLRFSELSQLHEALGRAEVRLFCGQDSIEGFVSDVMRK